MKKSIIVSLSLVTLFLNTLAQSSEDVRVNVPIKSVILYLDGAEVSQTKNMTVNAGRTMVVFTGLSPKLISKSIQVNVGNGAAVLSVSDKINFLSEQKQSPRVKQIRDSIEMYNDVLAQISYDYDAYNKEKTMLAKNESIGGHDKGVSIVDLKLAADYYRVRLKDINSELFKLDKKQANTQEAVNKRNNQLNEVIGDAQLPTAEIAVLISSTSKTLVDIDLKYVVKESGWVPSYDLISEDINKPVLLKYKAKVYNNSGVDWNDVKLKISSADPLKNASKPDLACWYLNFSTQTNYGYYNNNNAANNAPSAAYRQQKSMAQEQTLYEEENQVKGMKGKVKELPKITEEIQVSELSAEFDIKQSYSIPSDAKPYLIDVTSYNLNASYQYYSVPKVEKEAFMLARIAG
ncbi:MAG: mucoidy inhibitor MuiA family protein [Sphingobacteriaceae bacterium]|nr:mucoidy inhibitor MuiA family protein [Sphingobacteriaceae bacterium]